MSDSATPWIGAHQASLSIPEFIQTHVCWVDDAIQPSHPLLSPSASHVHPCIRADFTHLFPHSLSTFQPSNHTSGLILSAWKTMKIRAYLTPGLQESLPLQKTDIANKNHTDKTRARDCSKDYREKAQGPWGSQGGWLLKGVREGCSEEWLWTWNLKKE